VIDHGRKCSLQKAENKARKKFTSLHLSYPCIDSGQHLSSRQSSLCMVIPDAQKVQLDAQNQEDNCLVGDDPKHQLLHAWPQGTLLRR